MSMAIKLGTTKEDVNEFLNRIKIDLTIVPNVATDIYLETDIQGTRLSFTMPDITTGFSGKS